MKSKVFIGLGTNLGDKAGNLENAVTFIERKIGVVLRKSSIYKTAAWGKEDQDYFLNQVIEIQTSLSPHSTLKKCLEIEKSIGRVRVEKWGERIIDIDILYFNDDVINDENLSIPHPLLQKRKFVLIPLVEIAPNEIHPLFKVSNSKLLEKCTDKLKVEQLI